MATDYLEADAGLLPVHLLTAINTPLVLLLEGSHVIEEPLLELLRANGPDAMLCDGRIEQHQVPSLEVEGGQVVGWGQSAKNPKHAYVGAVLLTRETLQSLAARGDARWPASLNQVPALRAIDVGSAQVYSAEVRREAEAFWQVVETPADAERCKRGLLRGAQKHTLDIVAWHVNRPLETALTGLIADWPITPNQVTLLTSALAYVVAGLFLSGAMLPACLLTFVVNVLDGVDGKLARVKAMSSRLGQLEHSLDLAYEQSWYLSYFLATYMQLSSSTVLVVGFLMLLCDSFARHVSMQFRQVMGISLADSAPFDRAFRRFDGRRNTYSLHMLLGVIVGHPFWAVCSMAVHAFLTGTVYFLRAAMHLRNADRGVMQEG
jgi:phosphatidylglycerophosphate synthase